MQIKSANSERANQWGNFSLSPQYVGKYPIFKQHNAAGRRVPLFRILFIAYVLYAVALGWGALFSTLFYSAQPGWWSNATAQTFILLAADLSLVALIATFVTTLLFTIYHLIWRVQPGSFVPRHRFFLFQYGADLSFAVSMGLFAAMVVVNLALDRISSDGWQYLLLIPVSVVTIVAAFFQVKRRYRQFLVGVYNQWTFGTLRLSTKLTDSDENGFQVKLACRYPAPEFGNQVFRIHLRAFKEKSKRHFDEDGDSRIDWFREDLYTQFEETTAAGLREGFFFPIAPPGDSFYTEAQIRDIRWSLLIEEKDGTLWTFASLDHELDFTKMLVVG